ncbi:MAG: succinate dehydrogenase cytochrome b subunit [Prevotellaceae bacterium]|jgi:succinate dehydrogenase / fumarate reductase cytochrome b subunit|nr:succinate dehydrogenase cytochrome b subunit [Prevotellaceae bacterium]
MANIFLSSIGKKLVMSISGLFLMVFLVLHLCINLSAVVSQSAYNAACEFMDTNIFIRIMVPVLTLGVVVHIIFATIITLRNRKARPVKYAVGTGTKASTWASRNMFVLGLIVLGFLAIHLVHFWAKMQLQHFTGGVPAKDPYLLVKSTLENPINAAIYLAWFAALWFHLCHGFWSAFQSSGLNNSRWLSRLQVAAKAFATLVVAGLSVVVLYFALGLAPKAAAGGASHGVEPKVTLVQ